ncbi:MAG: type IV secretory system conjugative DNA transfer family protein [Nitriliruptorales bacterium]
MDPRPVRQEPPAGGFEIVVAVVGGLVVAVATVTFAGAWLAATLVGGRVSGGITDWLTVTGRLASTPADPTAAWGEQARGLPGPVLYWACTLTVAIVVGVLITAGVLGWRRWSSPSRSRFGVPTDARVARPRDARPLTIPGSVPPTGRLLLGRIAPHGPMLATEDRERHPAKGRRATNRQGDRGSVALIGPTRPGKTVLSSAGILGWDGPVVALSVKRDLYDTTAAARAGRGELAVFDPGGVTGLPSARWTPLRDVTTTSGAARAGRALAQAIPRNGVTGGDFWASHGETLTSAYMSLAGLSQLVGGEGDEEREPLTIGRLATWAYMHVGITDPTANRLVRLGLADDKPLEVRLLAKDAMTKLMAFEGEDPRIRASIYATARLAFEAWTEPAVSHSASLDPRAFYFADEIPPQRPRYVDLDWLMDGEPGRSNTLYLAAPSTEFARLAPVLGGLLGDLREQIHAWDIAGRRLGKPLLIVIDEAGQLELQWLPEEVSTIAGLGGMFVTGWQSKSQITHRYGTLADAVLGGHRSKVIFSGADDPSTLDYVSRVAGTEHVAQRGWSADTGGGRKTVSEHVQREDLLPAHVIRQMRRQEAVLLHGTLPPIHLRLVRWWEDHDLGQLVPTGADHKALPPPETGTCPLWPEGTTSPEPVLDPTVVAESGANLPRPRVQRDDHAAGSGARLPRPARPADRMQGQLDLVASLDEPVEANRIAGTCERCGARVPVGAGTTSAFGGRIVIRCHPTCP